MFEYETLFAVEKKIGAILKLFGRILLPPSKETLAYSFHISKLYDYNFFDKKNFLFFSVQYNDFYAKSRNNSFKLQWHQFSKKFEIYMNNVFFVDWVYGTVWLAVLVYGGQPGRTWQLELYLKFHQNNAKNNVLIQCWLKLSGLNEQNSNCQTRFSKTWLRLDKNQGNKSCLEFHQNWYAAIFSPKVPTKYLPQNGSFWFL